MRQPLILPRLYAIVDTDTCARRGLDPVATARAFLHAGVRLLQIRHKGLLDSRRLLALADEIVCLAAPHRALIIVNDRADVARASGAAGVHVGQGDLSVEDARAVLGSAAVIGVSTHTQEQVEEAGRGDADYVAVGPVFATATKATGYVPRGLDMVRRAAATGKPVVAIGGITLDRLPEVLDAGASSVAVIADLLARGGPEARARAFLARLAVGR